jgi:hypothetical protein
MELCAYIQDGENSLLTPIVLLSLQKGEDVSNPQKKKCPKHIKKHEIIKDPPQLTWDKPLRHDAQMGNLGNIISCIQTLNQ